MANVKQTKKGTAGTRSMLVALCLAMSVSVATAASFDVPDREGVNACVDVCSASVHECVAEAHDITNRCIDAAANESAVLWCLERFKDLVAACAGTANSCIEHCESPNFLHK